MKIRKKVGIIPVTFLIVAMLFAGGCATKNSSSQQVDMSDWEWVPRVWVEDNPFTGNHYRHCVYDMYHAAYFCPPGTR
jgi:hypothetical protein